MHSLPEILVHVSLFLAFIVLFYFFAVIPFQQQSVTSDLKAVLEDSVTSLRLTHWNSSLPELKASAMQALSSTPIPEDKENNASIVKWIAISVPLVVVMCLLSAFLLARRQGTSLKELLASTTIILLACAATEATLLLGFVLQIVNVDANYVKVQVVKALQNEWYPCSQVQDTVVSMFPFAKQYFPSWNPWGSRYTVPSWGKY